MIFSPEMRATILPFYLIGFGLFFAWGLLGSLYDWFKKRNEKAKKEVAGPNSASDAKTTVDDKPSSVVDQEGKDAFRFCPKCGEKNDPALYCCTSCHTPLKAINSLSKRCTSCGALNRPNLELCGICEEPLDAESKDDAPAPKSSKSKKSNWWPVVIIVIAIIILRPVIRDFMTGFMSGFKESTSKVSSPATVSDSFFNVLKYSQPGKAEATVVTRMTRVECERSLSANHQNSKSAEMSKSEICVADEGQYDNFFLHKPNQDWYSSLHVVSGPTNESSAIMIVRMDNSTISEFAFLRDCWTDSIKDVKEEYPSASWTERIISPKGEVDIATGELKQPQQDAAVSQLPADASPIDQATKERLNAAIAYAESVQ